MFELDFGKLLVIAVVALIFLGPERLPTAARMAGLWIRKMRAQWNAVKAELENELADDELRRNLRNASEAFHDGVQQMRSLPEALRVDPAATAQPASVVPIASAPAANEPGQEEAALTAPAVHEPSPGQPALPLASAPDADPAQLSLLHADLLATEPLATEPLVMQPAGLPAAIEPGRDARV